MKVVNVNDVLEILYKYGKYIFVTDEKRYSSMVDEIANLKALEQKPCDDCISRQAVLDKLNRLIEVERLQGTDEMGYGRERVSAYESMIFEINSKYLYPSVNPQEPCDDCISRQAVDELSKELVHTTRDKADFLCNFWEGLQKLPPVTPKEKTGHEKLTNHEWIDFLTEQFDISRTSAKEMLHAMMSVKKEDNFKKQFSQGKKGFSQGFSQGRK